MLTFFRRIRKGLLDGGRTSKYLLYAVGEVLLVMIGILLALQVNNWNEERKGRIEETRLIRNINQEFINNLNNLDSVQPSIDNTIRSLSKLLLSMSNSSSNQYRGEKLDSLLVSCSGFPSWSRSDLNIRGIESSGKLGGLRTEELRRLIYDWIGKHEDVKRIEQYGVESNLNFINYIMENGSWREIDKYALISEGGSTLMPSNDHLLEDYKFENAIDDYLVWLRHKKNMYNSIRKDILKVIDASIVN